MTTETQKKKADTVSVASVYKTKDYSKFKTLQGNREVSKVNVKRLKDSMSKRQLISPIITNEKGEIIDGQHRFNACKELGLPIHFIVAEGYGLNEVQVLNTNSKNWTNVDYLNAYCDLGKPSYILFADFMNRFPQFSIKACYAILLKTSTGGYDKRMLMDGKQVAYTSSFKDGSLKIDSLDEGIDLANKLLEIGKYTDAYNKLGFVTTIIALNNKDNFDIDYFIDKISRTPYDLSNGATSKQYREIIEDIYNHRNRNKISFKY